MKHWRRIFFVSLILLGGTVAFAGYRLVQFNNALDYLNASILSIAKMPPTSEIFPISPTPTLTETGLKLSLEETASAPATASTSTTSTEADLEPFFVFPKINDKVYIGCSYRLSFESSIQLSTETRLLETILVDAGVREVVDPNKSNLTRNNEIDPDTPILNWKVGTVWLGKYYIKVSNIDGTNPKRSNIFTVGGMPKDANVDEKEEICKESGGLFR